MLISGCYFIVFDADVGVDFVGFVVGLPVWFVWCLIEFDLCFCFIGFDLLRCFCDSLVGFAEVFVHLAVWFVV